MNWTWDSHRWKTSIKLLLGIATIWPIIYMVLFFLAIFSFVLFIPSEGRSNQTSQDIDLLQLERKIENGELKLLKVRPREFIAIDRENNREYHTDVTNETSRSEVLAKAQEHDANGQARVAKIEEENDQPVSAAFPAGIVVIFGAHILTIFLILGLTPFYIVLAVKNDGLDQTMRIIWVVLVCMLGFFAMPVYWYLYIWRKPPVSLSGPDLGQSPGESTSSNL